MDIERTIEFILDQQAKLAVGLQRLESTVEKIVTVQEGTLSIINALAQSVDALTGRMEHLTDRMEQLTVAHQRLAEAQAHTEERLNALIAIVNGIIRRPPGQPS